MIFYVHNFYVNTGPNSNLTLKSIWNLSYSHLSTDFRGHTPRTLLAIYIRWDNVKIDLALPECYDVALLFLAWMISKDKKKTKTKTKHIGGLDLHYNFESNFLALQLVGYEENCLSMFYVCLVTLSEHVRYLTAQLLRMVFFLYCSHQHQKRSFLKCFKIRNYLFTFVMPKTMAVSFTAVENNTFLIEMNLLRGKFVHLGCDTCNLKRRKLQLRNPFPVNRKSCSVLFSYIVHWSFTIVFLVNDCTLFLVFLTPTKQK